jgi:hypothetical protein
MSSQTFHQTPGSRIWKTTAKEQFRLGNLDLFEPAAQEIYWDEDLQQSTQKPKLIEA